MRLNRIYRALITEIRRQEGVRGGGADPASIERLRVSQRSWLVYRDVKTGRGHVNFSEWDKDQDGSDNTAEMMQKGKMPFLPYLFLHSEARLSDADKAQLMKGLEAIQAMGDPGSGGGEAKSKKEGDKD